MKEILIDRRKSIRINGDFNLELSKGKNLKLGKTVDVNLRGMCCEVSGKVPVFEEVQIRFKIPLKGKKYESLSCKGVVVRLDSTSKKGVYRMAFYFTEWDPLSKEKMERFMKSAPFSQAA